MPQKTKRLLLIRQDEVGDYILFRNFIAPLAQSKKYAAYDIYLCGNSSWRNLAEKIDSEYVRGFIWIDRRLWLNSMAYRWAQSLRIFSIRADTVIQSRYSREYQVDDRMVRASRSPHRIGHFGNVYNTSAAQALESSSWYTQWQSTPSPLFEFERNRQFFEGVIEEPIVMAKPSLPADKLPAYPGVPVPYVLLFTGARLPAKRWAWRNFMQLGTKLYREWGLHIVVDAGLNAAQPSWSVGDEFIDTTGKTSLIDLVGLVRGARLVISNDTGVIHVAAALATPFVCVSNGSFYQRFSPYPKNIFPRSETVFPSELVRKIQANDIAPLPAMHHAYAPYPIDEISVERVLAAAKILLV